MSNTSRTIAEELRSMRATAHLSQNDVYEGTREFDVDEDGKESVTVDGIKYDITREGTGKGTKRHYTIGRKRYYVRDGIKQANLSRYESDASQPNGETLQRLRNFYRTASHAVREQEDAYAGVLGVQGRTAGKFREVRDLMATPTPKDWMVEKFLARKFVTIFAGQEGSGKTLGSNTVAIALASGADECFGFRTPGVAHRVLVIDCENVLDSGKEDEDPDGSLITSRLQAQGMDAITAGNITLLGIDGTSEDGFDLDKDMDVLESVLVDAEKDGLPYSCVILDSFTSLWTSGNSTTPQAGRVLRKLNKVASRHNVAVLLLHHTNKAGAAYAGHHSIGGTVAALFTFSYLETKSEVTGKKEQHPTARYIFPYKYRLGEKPAPRVVNTSAQGLTSALTADEYEGFEPNFDGMEDEDATDE